ncbi:MAG: Nramp family divalent metal transporter, partial [Armatimonadetes bacterium]|nr:Nramp family divalent metal transporter [Armatimonadota bacterium]
MSGVDPWRFVRPVRHSLEEVYATIPIPVGAWWRRMLAFAGPGFLVAVGYMDPGNWATDIAGGAAFNYALLSVILVANFVAVFLQAMAARLGLVTGRDLAQACRETYSRPVAIFLWLWAEVGIVACDVAEVLGAAIALLLLFHIPLLTGVVLTGLDVLIVLALQNRGFRVIEAIVITLIAIIVVLFGVELFFARPEWAAVWRGFLPHQQLVTNPTMLYIGLGIVGATVMPHNLFLHSSIVQTRKIGRTDADLRSAIRFALADSAIALTIALCVNAAILIV